MDVTSAGTDPLIQLSGIEKVYQTGQVGYRALRGVDLTIDAGEMVAVIGPSGSGKTTIMNVITGIDRPTSGTVIVGGKNLRDMNEEGLAVWRGRNVGIVLQFFQLLPTLTALENVTLPMDLVKIGTPKSRASRARENLERVGLGEFATRLPSELSGGEQQRVAIARAMACDPKILVGDEPAGNLDTENAERIFELFTELNNGGTTVLYVTHNLETAGLAPRTISIRDGLITGDTRR